MTGYPPKRQENPLAWFVADRTTEMQIEFECFDSFTGAYFLAEFIISE
jgi:hypothetical protein